MCSVRSSDYVWSDSQTRRSSCLVGKALLGLSVGWLMGFCFILFFSYLQRCIFLTKKRGIAWQCQLRVKGRSPQVQKFPKERCSPHVRTYVSGQMLVLTYLMDPGGFSVCPKLQLILCFYIKPKKLQQGLLHGHFQDWAIVQHSFLSTWENKRTRHLASYTASWGLEQRIKGIGKPLGIGKL